MPILRMRLPNRLREADEVMETVGSVCLVIVAKGSVSRIVESLWRKDRPGQVRSRNFLYENLAAPAGRSTLINDTGGRTTGNRIHASSRAEPPPFRKLRLGSATITLD